MCTESSVCVAEITVSQSLAYGRVKDTFTDNHRRVVASMIMLVCNKLAMIVSCTGEAVEGCRVKPYFFSMTEVNIKYLGKHGRDLKISILNAGVLISS